MLSFKCKNCGGEVFSVHRKDWVVRCEGCFLRFKFDSKLCEWVEWHPLKEAAQVFIQTCKETIHHAEEKVQSIREWMKEHGIQKYRKPKIQFGQNFDAITEAVKKVQKENGDLHFLTDSWEKEDSLKEKWKNEIKAIQENKAVWFGANFHFGKLRGAHIGKTLHRDLKRLGIDSELVFVDGGAWVKPVQGKVEVCGNR